MKKLNKDKRGTDKILSIYWFTILFIVAGGVIYMVAIFYGNPYDIREAEANILINKIADCLSRGGKLRMDLEEITSDNFLKKCNLNFNVEDIKGWKEQEQYFVKIQYVKFGEEPLIDYLRQGNSNLENLCEQKGKRLPVCVERSFYTLGEDGKQKYEIKIKSIVRKTEKNVQ